MAHCEAEHAVFINRSGDEVFAFLADAENDPKWRPGVLSIRRTSGNGLGAAYEQHVAGPLGRSIRADIVITEFQPGSSIAFQTTAGIVRPAGRYELRQRDGGTAVLFRLTAEARGLKSVLTPMIRRTMQREVAHLDDLKRVLE